jgi:hypothetical protein
MEAAIMRDPTKIELIDTLDTNESMQEVIIPYLTGLYKDLVLRSDEPLKGIPRVTLIDVRVR